MTHGQNNFQKTRPHPLQEFRHSGRAAGEGFAGARDAGGKSGSEMMCVWLEKSAKLVVTTGNFDFAKARAAFKKGHGLGQVGRASDAGGPPSTPELDLNARRMAELTTAIQIFSRRVAAPVGTLNPYHRVEAETIARESGVETAKNADACVYVTGTNDGDYIKVCNVDFGDDDAAKPRPVSA